MRKHVTVCLILMIVLVFVACNPATNSPVEESAKDPNVPPASEFMENATAEEIALMKSMIANSPSEDEHLVSDDITMTFECLKDAKINDKPASGKLVYKSKRTGKSMAQAKLSGTITMEGVTYTVDDFRVTAIMTASDMQYSFAGSIKDSNGIEYKEKEARNLATVLLNNLLSSASNGKKIKMSSLSNSIHKNADKTTRETFISSGVSDDFEGIYYSSESYYVIENESHKITLGEINKNDGKDGKEFLYLSLDGKYFREAVYKQVR